MYVISIIWPLLSSHLSSSAIFFSSHPIYITLHSQHLFMLKLVRRGESKRQENVKCLLSKGIKNESVGTRTQDLRLKRPLLYQLSYTPKISGLTTRVCTAKHTLYRHFGVFATKFRQFLVLKGLFLFTCPKLPNRYNGPLPVRPGQMPQAGRIGETWRKFS